MSNTAPSNRYVEVMRAALRGEWNDIKRVYNLPPCNNIDIEDDNSNIILLNPLTGDTILHMCAQCGQTDIMEQMLKIIPASKRLLSVSNKKGNTVLHEAARTGIVKMAMLIIEKELDGGGDQLLVSVPNLNGETPIYWAAMYGHKDMLLFLNTTASSRGITSTSTSMVSPLTIRTSDHSTILHAAVLVESYGNKLYSLCNRLV
ncbi:hypothetical protein MKW98_010884 [Papaver atlanticum]|uniref:Uncharacterized protein n=1 Tax=Papaver atlanticum TaxID=357466 RepID=A0AAD4SKJ5_9MAGN|nr:hypothetical protein MKW98_010884 [Papaver atlanticum]